MHPQVIQDHPGNCPICGMKLTPIRRAAGGTNAAAGSAVIAIDPVTIQNMGIRTATVRRGPLRRVIRTVGTIDYNETALADVTTKFKGWIEKLHVAATGQQVRRGDPLFEIYSPELYSAQAEYALALQQATDGSAGATALLQDARTKLKLFDISDAQIAELEKTRQLKKTLFIAAPIDGFVIEKMVVEGQMVDAGMKLYRIANLDTVWVQAQIFEQDLVFVKPGQPAVVTLSSLPEREFQGQVNYIYPALDEKTRTARVRLELPNPDHALMPGMFATVELKAELERDALLVPESAVLRTGKKNTVFVALDGGRFEPRTVALGPRGEGDVYQVLNGLLEGEQIVVSGQFMLDSESQLREAILKMTSPDSGIPQIGTFTRESQTPSLESGAAAPAPPALYTCPMASDADVVTDTPGQCPKCGMDLVPVGSVPHGKVAEENWRRQRATGHQH
ncbi:MAG: efflux RND transporter periplasmic adaptor subunit [Verrucomicrobiae bacterium]|nr:efflux RND transporter periplasmic adaptor subunit [Verrucomicrobiae bacterium]